MVAITTVDFPYVEPNEDAVECSFRSLEVASATYTGKNSKVPTPHLSKTTWMGVKQTLGKGAKAGWGLGKKLQGKKWAVMIMPKKDHYGLDTSPVIMKGEGKQKSVEKDECLALKVKGMMMS